MTETQTRLPENGSQEATQSKIRTPWKGGVQVGIFVAIVCAFIGVDVVDLIPKPFQTLDDALIAGLAAMVLTWLAPHLANLMLSLVSWTWTDLLTPTGRAIGGACKSQSAGDFWSWIKRNAVSLAGLVALGVGVIIAVAYIAEGDLGIYVIVTAAYAVPFFMILASIIFALRAETPWKVWVWNLIGVTLAVATVVKIVIWGRNDVLTGVWTTLQAVGITAGIFLIASAIALLAAKTWGRAQAARQLSREAALERARKRQEVAAKAEEKARREGHMIHAEIPKWIKVFTFGCAIVVSFFVSKGIFPEATTILNYVTAGVVAVLVATLFYLVEGALLKASYRATSTPKSRLLALFALGFLVASITGFLSLSALISLVGQNTRVQTAQVKVLAAQSAFLAEVETVAGIVESDSTQQESMRASMKEGLAEMKRGNELCKELPATFIRLTEGSKLFASGAAKASVLLNGAKAQKLMEALSFLGDQNPLELGAATLRAVPKALKSMITGDPMESDGVDWGAALAAFLVMLALDYSIIIVGLILWITSGLGRGRIISVQTGQSESSDDDGSVEWVLIDLGLSQGTMPGDIMDVIEGGVRKGSLKVTNLIGSGAAQCTIEGRPFRPQMGWLVNAGH